MFDYTLLYITIVVIICGVDLWERSFLRLFLGEFRVSNYYFFVEKCVDKWLSLVDKTRPTIFVLPRSKFFELPDQLRLIA